MDVVTRKGNSLNGGMKHCRDVGTGNVQLAVCSASCLFVLRSSL